MWIERIDPNPTHLNMGQFSLTHDNPTTLRSGYTGKMQVKIESGKQVEADFATPTHACTHEQAFQANLDHIRAFSM